MAEKLYLFARGSPTRGNNDDRRQWRKQGVAVGAAASKTPARRKQCAADAGCRNPALSAEQTERLDKGEVKLCLTKLCRPRSR